MPDHRLNPPEPPPIPDGVRIICRCGAEFESDTICGEDRMCEAEDAGWTFGYGVGLTFDMGDVGCVECNLDEEFE